jgi:predicted transposase/invertase (TIGR01784 family)
MVEDGKRDVISQIQSAEKRGERRGEKRGEKRGKKLEKIQTAKNLIKAGIDLSIIAQVVEFPLEEVQKLV